MITPELIEYIRAEFAKGRSREEVHAELVKDGGWGEIDLNEAFRTVIPMQGFTAPNTVVRSAGTAQNKTKSFKKIFETSLFVVIGLACLILWYFFQPQIADFWNKGTDKLAGLSFLFSDSDADEKQDDVVLSSDNPVVKEAVNTIKDCGVADSPDFKNPLSYKNDAVLVCLGNSALRCVEARAVLRNALFPDVFEIVKNQDICDFKLSYEKNSVLADITGKKLANQYISCPLGIVKAVSENKKISFFEAPNLENLAEYASQIYFYGTVGVFMENDANQKKIQSLGCSGDYISSMVASYLKMKEKK